MEERIKKIEEEIEVIKDRNKRVEADKAWETSYFRIFIISLIIYIVAVKFLYYINAENYYLNALVPPIGYFLSVQTLPFIKKWWIKNRYKGNA